MRMMPVAGTTKRIIAGRGERGASMPLALLCFLVCAVIGSIVLAAGSISAGRIASLAEDDRLYYSLNSAAGVIQNELLGTDGTGYEVTVEVTHSTTENNPTTDASYTLNVKTNGVSKADDEKLSVIEQASVFLLLGEKVGKVSDLTAPDRWSGDPETFWATARATPSSSFSVPLTLTGDSVITDVTGSVEMDASGGDLVFYLQDAANSSARLKLTCTSTPHTGELLTTVSNPDGDRTISITQSRSVEWRPGTVEWVK